MDAVYPFLYMAKATGNQKYLDAGIALFEWGDNVTKPNGSWTNTLDPNSWDGITVFGAIALAETLKYHGDLLEEERREKWTERLIKAADFVYHRFSIDTANINYGATTIYALNLIGKLLGKQVYIDRSRAFAEEIKNYFTQDSHFLFGEIKPRKRQSTKGLYGIDLGYNVEESLNSLVMYALLEEDEDLLALLTKSLESHLEFMLPDGGWDNSWGTRQYKWTYWGSRTSDGCQAAFGMMAGRNPAFGTAAVRNTELLRRCTIDGLLHGGLHYVSHGIKPCIHHTFTHAKPLAILLDHWDDLPAIDTSKPLPRTIANGIKHFADLDTTLFACGDWRGTLCAYDATYRTEANYHHATGGALAILYHQKAGLLLSASMAKYQLVEAFNQQPAPGEDIALTPRIEVRKDGFWYTNLFDLAATLHSTDKNGEIELTARVQLKDEGRTLVKGTASDFELVHRCTEEKMQIIAQTKQNIEAATAFVLPLISPTGEELTQINPYEITIQKPSSLVKIKANVPLEIKDMSRSRTFNMVPGVEAIPILAFFNKNLKQVEISIEVIE